jgi:hypothetical protein
MGIFECESLKDSTVSIGGGEARRVAVVSSQHIDVELGSSYGDGAGAVSGDRYRGRRIGDRSSYLASYSAGAGARYGARYGAGAGEAGGAGAGAVIYKGDYSQVPTEPGSRCVYTINTLPDLQVLIKKIAEGGMGVGNNATHYVVASNKTCYPIQSSTVNRGLQFCLSFYPLFPMFYLLASAFLNIELSKDMGLMDKHLEPQDVKENTLAILYPFFMSCIESLIVCGLTMLPYFCEKSDMLMGGSQEKIMLSNKDDADWMKKLALASKLGVPYLIFNPNKEQIEALDRITANKGSGNKSATLEDGTKIFFGCSKDSLKLHLAFFMPTTSQMAISDAIRVGAVFLGPVKFNDDQIDDLFRKIKGNTSCQNSALLKKLFDDEVRPYLKSEHCVNLRLVQDALLRLASTLSIGNYDDSCRSLRRKLCPSKVVDSNQSFQARERADAEYESREFHKVISRVKGSGRYTFVNPSLHGGSFNLSAIKKSMKLFLDQKGFIRAKEHDVAIDDLLSKLESGVLGLSGLYGGGKSEIMEAFRYAFFKNANWAYDSIRNEWVKGGFVTRSSNVVTNISSEKPFFCVTKKDVALFSFSGLSFALFLKDVFVLNKNSSVGIELSLPIVITMFNILIRMVIIAYMYDDSTHSPTVQEIAKPGDIVDNMEPFPGELPSTLSFKEGVPCVAPIFYTTNDPLNVTNDSLNANNDTLQQVQARV